MAVIPCAIVRGGTSKGLFLLDEHLPASQPQRDRLLLALMGSPDPRQIDGLGGADPLTSTVAIVARSAMDGIDVEYESLEVGIAEAQVQHGLMSGNLIAGAGYFALAEGLIAPEFPVTTINIYCRSNHKIIVAKVPVGRHGDLPAGNPPVSLVFYNPGGAVTGQLLPAGEPISIMTLDRYRDIQVSIVDAGALYAFVRADALGLVGSENVAMLDGDPAFRASIELLRHKVAEHINRLQPANRSALPPRQVKVAIISPPAAGQHTVDIVARVINAENVHKAYAVSGGICLAAAAAIPGTLVNAIIDPVTSPFQLRIGHPSGILSLLTYWSASPTGTVINAAEIQRSARIILRGSAYIADDFMNEAEPAQPAEDYLDAVA